MKSFAPYLGGRQGRVPSDSLRKFLQEVNLYNLFNNFFGGRCGLFEDSAPDFEFIFMFEHSQGHACKKDGALEASSMSRSFGGVQEAKIQSSRIVNGYLGPFTNCILNVRDIQSMAYYGELDEGPWWIVTPEGREAQRQSSISALSGSFLWGPLAGLGGESGLHGEQRGEVFRALEDLLCMALKCLNGF